MNMFIKLTSIDRDGYTMNLLLPVGNCIFEESKGRRNHKGNLLVNVACNGNAWETVHTILEIELKLKDFTRTEN